MEPAVMNLCGCAREKRCRGERWCRRWWTAVYEWMVVAGTNGVVSGAAGGFPVWWSDEGVNGVVYGGEGER